MNISSHPARPVHRLEVGTHSFIRRTSYVRYKNAAVMEASSLIDKISKSKPYEDMSADVLNAICAKISTRTVKRSILEFYKAATQNL